ncbi:MAG TPA: coenzyme F420-0:L-glutamate ligase [Candidatus Dormibacteraeota bacterium]|nr:coenzyme F420-0:L-glutamate ligase [Candidatus Dormibacteraeota bacterium]
MSDRIVIEAIPGIPFIAEGDDIGLIIVEAARQNRFDFNDGDVLCIASKAVSTAEGRQLSLEDIEVSEVAKSIHEQIPRKDPRAIQVILDQTGQPDGSRIDLDTNYIAGWLPSGMRLTSSGVDKLSANEVILLPEDSDKSARAIGKTLLDQTGVRVAVIVTDSDGRVDKTGSTQLAIGLYGVPALRVNESKDSSGKISVAEETICDLLAGSAALIMGQRGTNKPAVVIRGYQYGFDENSSINDALSRKPQ